jgi:hypothetical protein
MDCGLMNTCLLRPGDYTASDSYFLWKRRDIHKAIGNETNTYLKAINKTEFLENSVFTNAYKKFPFFCKM